MATIYEAKRITGIRVSVRNIGEIDGERLLGNEVRMNLLATRATITRSPKRYKIIIIKETRSLVGDNKLDVELFFFQLTVHLG